ncbi:hypothetical protein [Marmoricola sp. RAF53]|uniref:hypothetical protein n=1 Tax=Marmoricola sp. RAF53 TaxID=3233059 RepID=UPI003F9B1CD3
MIKRVRAGHASYDALRSREQAVVRATWDTRVAERIAALDLEADFLAAGETWSEADGEGYLVVRGGPQGPGPTDA